MPKIVNNTRSATSTQTEVVISCNGGSIAAMIQLSGKYKSKNEYPTILKNWNERGIRATVLPNPYGEKKQFVLKTASNKLVGYLNFQEPNLSLEEAEVLVTEFTEFNLGSVKLTQEEIEEV